MDIDYKGLTPMAAIIAISIFLVKGLLDLFKRRETHNESKTEKLIDAITLNTTAVQLLTLRMDYLEKKLNSIPEIEKDLAKLGQKVREMSK